MLCQIFIIILFRISLKNYLFYLFILYYCVNFACEDYTQGEPYTITNKYILSLVANQVFKSVNRSYFFDIAWQIIPDVASVWPKREFVGISSSKWYW